MNYKILIATVAIAALAAGTASAKAHHHMAKGHHHHGHAHMMMAKENYAAPGQPIPYGEVDAYVHGAPK